MKKNKMLGLMIFAFIALLLPRTLKSQDKEKILAEGKEAKAAFIKTDASMSKLFNDSYGYVIFPNVGKGALVVGGSGGSGAVHERGKAIGIAKMVQVTVGAQAGGEAYREVIFFENKDAMDRFKENKFEFTGQVSAVAARSGAAADVKYRDGVAVYSQEKGGLMLDASVGGQKFTYEPL
jgi:lipid-binding SYLF domain-containing protein